MKFVKMAAIATMALTLFASCNKKDEPKKEVSKMNIRVDLSALRSMEAPVPGGTTTAFESLKVIVNDGEVVENLDAAKIAKAVSTDGYTFAVKSKPTKVVVEANSYVADPEIATLQGVATVDATYDPANAADKIALFSKKIPLIGSTTTIEGPTTPSGTNDKVYKATVKPTPEVARIEVCGKIVGQANAGGKNAFKNIDVEAVYMNNYLNKKADEERYFTPSDGNTAFAGTPALKAQMNDAIAADMKQKFEEKNVAAAYQIFPTKAGETEFDHIILKVKVQYDTDVVKNRTQEFEEGYVTIVRYKDKAASSAIAKFEAGKIYKLDLAELNAHFKTDDKGNPDTPVTPDPEHDGSNKLTVVVETFTWTAVDITPDGFKK